MFSLLRPAAFAAMTLLALFVGVVALRYAAPSPVGVPPPLAANAFAWALPAHAVTAGLALLLGPLQFIRARSGRRARWHRVSGAAYAALCLASAPAGLVLALGTTSGPVAAAGFGLLALAWFAATGLGVRAVLQRRFAEHGRWMLRSFALTLAAVSLRLQLPLSGVLGLPFEDAYPMIAFLCWVPNLMAVELWLAWRARGGRRPVGARAQAA
jgi:hypothetical protein